MVELETVEQSNTNIVVEDTIVDAIKIAAANEDSVSLKKLTDEMHHADFAALLGLMQQSVRAQIILTLTPNFAPEILTYLDDEIISEIVDLLGKDHVANAIAELETDDAVSVIEDLDENEQQELLNSVPDDARAELEEGLAYPEESAGRLMQKKFVSIPEFWDIGQTIDHMRNSKDLPEDFYEIIIVDPRFKPIGTTMLSRIIKNKRSTPIKTVMKTDIHPINTNSDQEDVAEIFRRYGIVEAPVINESGRCVGVITIDDVITVIKEEEEEDFMRAGGIMEQDIHASIIQTAKQRLPWLLINLLTAAVAAWVISQFEGTIEKMVALAVLMPVIASLSGNAGTQSLTIAIRGIATREIQRHNALPIIRKELLTNLVNSIMLGLISSTVIFIIYKDIELAAIFSAAVIITLTLAGFAGALIPLLLSRTRFDPAISSGVFLTTLTDIISFFSFLGLASWFLLLN